MSLAGAAARIALGTSIARPRRGAALPDGDSAAPRVPVAVLHSASGEPGAQVMGVGAALGPAYAAARAAAGHPLPPRGRLHVMDDGRHRRDLLLPLQALTRLGFELLATPELVPVLRRHGIAAASAAEPDGGATLVLPAPGTRPDPAACPALRGVRELAVLALALTQERASDAPLPALPRRAGHARGAERAFAPRAVLSVR